MFPQTVFVSTFSSEVCGPTQLNNIQTKDVPFPDIVVAQCGSL